MRNNLRKALLERMRSRALGPTELSDDGGHFGSRIVVANRFLAMPFAYGWHDIFQRFFSVFNFPIILIIWSSSALRLVEIDQKYVKLSCLNAALDPQEMVQRYWI